MTRILNSGVAQAPDFTPHRANVTSADGTVTNLYAGMVSQTFEDIFVQLGITGGSGVSLTVECLMWSDLAGQFVSMSTPQKVTGISTPDMLKFNVGGCRFFIAVTGTFGGCTVNVDVAGANPVLVQHA